MKTTIISLALSLAFSITIAGNKQHEHGSSDIMQDMRVLIIKGKVLHSGYSFTPAMINLYDDNEKVRTIKTTKSGKFQINLMADKYYTIEIVAAGYITKRMAFDTRIKVMPLVARTFSFDLVLFENETIDGVDDYIMDFPMALVSYDYERRQFDYSRKYTASMILEHRTLYYKADQLRQLRAHKN